MVKTRSRSRAPTPYAAYNWQSLEILERSNSYAATPINAFDQNAIDLYGLRIAPTVTAHEICDSAIGQASAQLILQRGLYIRNTYMFKLSWEYCLLEPMDLVTLTDAGLGLNNTAVRIIEIEEDKDGFLTVTAEEFPGGTATAVAYPVQTSSGNSTNRNVVPTSVNVPMIFEPPAALTAGAAQVWMAVSGRHERRRRSQLGRRRRLDLARRHDLYVDWNRVIGIAPGRAHGLIAGLCERQSGYGAYAFRQYGGEQRGLEYGDNGGCAKCRHALPRRR